MDIQYISIHFLLGTDCSEEVDECSISDCNEENTVRCETSVDFYICHCKLGYTGEKCQQPVTESPTTDERVGPSSKMSVRFYVVFFVYVWDYFFLWIVIASYTLI